MPWRVIIVTCIVGAIAGLGNARAWGQMIVHAMTGTIRSVNPTQLTATSSGLTQTFSVNEKSHLQRSWSRSRIRLRTMMPISCASQKASFFRIV